MIQLFRVDDVSWDMNYENFKRFRELMFKYGVKPIIGVIPANNDEKLKHQVGMKHIDPESFWREVLFLQKEHDWAVALHGYDHVYITEDSGIFKTNKRAEFAGLTLAEQEEKIRKGISVFSEHCVSIDAFMAPAHSMDWNTVEALKRNGISVVTDGHCAYPYKKRGVLFIPQVWPWPRKKVFGIYTACFHINSWNDSNFVELERFIVNNLSICGSFEDIIIQAQEKHIWWMFANLVTSFAFPFGIKVRGALSKVKKIC